MKLDCNEYEVPIALFNDDIRLPLVLLVEGTTWKVPC